MATRFYLPASTSATAISPTPSTDWEDTSLVGRAVTSHVKSSDAMASVSLDDSSNADRDVIIRQYVSAPLVAGQTVTGGQALKAQVRVQESSANNNVFLAVGIRVIASDGSTVRKVVLAVTRDGTEIASASLQNRQFTATSAATNYTTQTGDRVVLELGVGGDPSGGNHHDTTFRLGDAAASDLSEDDTSTTDNNPWIQLNDTLSFVGELTAAGAPAFTSAGLLSGTGALTGAATAAFTSAGDIAGVGALATTDKSITFTNTGVLSGLYALTAAANVEFTSAGALTGTGDLTAAAAVAFTNAGDLTGVGEVTAAAAVAFTSTGALTGAGDLTAAANAQFAGIGVLTGIGDLVAAATVAFTNAGDLTNVGGDIGELIAAAGFSFTGTGVIESLTRGDASHDPESRRSRSASYTPMFKGKTPKSTVAKPAVGPEDDTPMIISAIFSHFW